jgi:FMN-dependent NADH-azoreductase
MKVLHIDSSILGDVSVSRVLSAAVVNKLRATNADLSVTYRDLAKDPLPQMDASVFPLAPAGSSGLSVKAAALRQSLDDMLAADVLVIGAPMYNFGLPTQLKTWIDSIAVSGETFRYSASGPVGLLNSKKAIVLSSRGAVFQGTPFADLEHQESHLVGMLGFLGIADSRVIRAEGIALGPEVRKAAITKALEQVEQLSL